MGPMNPLPTAGGFNSVPRAVRKQFIEGIQAWVAFLVDMRARLDKGEGEEWERRCWGRAPSLASEEHDQGSVLSAMPLQQG
jgi:hypothetical protein